jgi:hypothetical protein
MSTKHNCDKCKGETTNHENLIIFDKEIPFKKDVCDDCIFILHNWLAYRVTGKESKQIHEKHQVDEIEFVANAKKEDEERLLADD